MFESGHLVAIMDNLYAAGLFGGLGTVTKLLLRLFFGFVRSIQHLAHLIGPPADELRRSRWRHLWTICAHTFKSYLPGNRSTHSNWQKNVSDFQYHERWGWYFYIRGLDTLEYAFFVRSEQAFEAATRCAPPQPGDNSQLIQSDFVELIELSRFLPLIEAAILEEGMPDDPCCKKLQKQLNEPKYATLLSDQAPAPTIAIERFKFRMLAFLFHRCQSPLIGTTPTGEHQDKGDPTARRIYIAELAEKLYRKAIPPNDDVTELDKKPAWLVLQRNVALDGIG